MNPKSQSNIAPRTVLEVIQRSSEFLARKGVDSPRLQAELLLAHLLKLPRMRLYLEFERVLTPLELDELRELIRRRGRREPVQHIIGSTSFCGVELAVNRHALIPRPETELLAEQGWHFLERLGDPSNPRFPTVLDFGTGTGCLAIVLALRCPTARIHALDVSAEALALAEQNALRHGVHDRIVFRLGDGFAALPDSQRFDLIISNPPYIPTSEIPALQPEVRDHDPSRALDGGPDGLDYYRRLAKQAQVFLRPAGRLVLEFGDGQASALRQIFAGQNWVVEAVVEDYTHRPRILIATKMDSHG